jgi:hypothetical protein
MPPDHAALAYPIALALTLAIETPIVAATLRRWYGVRPLRGIGVGMAANALTHPIVWFVLPGWLLPTLGYLGYLLVAEAFAWLAEAALYWLATRRDAPAMLLLSLLANLASFVVGASVQLAVRW